MTGDDNSIGTLKQIWFTKVIPLLNEYFFGEWEKLKKILNEFVEENNKQYRFKTINDFNDDKDFENAIKSLNKK